MSPRILADSVSLQPDSSARTVLVLTHQDDMTADLVVKELHNRGTRVFRADTGDFPLSLSVSAQFDSLWHGELRGVDGSVELADIRSIYVRRPTAFRFPPAMTDAERQFATREGRRGIVGLLMSLPCAWVNHPARAADAEYKPFQLASAAACGMAVPRTVITNVPDDVEQHSTFLGSPAVYKTLASASVADGERVSIIYTTDVTRADMADSRVALTAHQFQARIPKVRDVRATVIGRQVFAVNILVDEKTAGGLLDWRRDYATLRYEPTSLPPEVEASLLTLMERLELSFAAADFVVTADNQHHFVDLNPSGQWGWIQDATGLPIAAAIAAHLAGDEQ
jgi:ATP-grasp ribosomal peptide maturase